MNQNGDYSNIPLIVDLDGTLIKSDILHESVLILIRKNILYFFLLPLWLLKGVYHLKNEVNKRIKINPKILPYNAEFLTYLKEEKEKGRKLVLATASFQNVANEIANYLGIFSEVYGSGNGINLKGKNKRDLMLKLFGENMFDYAGDSKADLIVFKSCNQPILVNAGKQIAKKSTKKFANLKIFKSGKKIGRYFKTIRIYQWIKNSLVLIPLITSQNWFNIDKIKISLITIFSFSLIASAGYVINDLLDLKSDRIHPRKKNRPVASGDVSILSAIFISISLLFLGFGLSIIFDRSIFLIILLYFTISLSYSVLLKRVVLIDLFVLAMLYTLRIIAGGIAIDVTLSFWLLAFSVFVFYSLAVMKRCAEIISKGNVDSAKKIAGRGYMKEDLSYLWHIGISSGYIGILIFALYINSKEVTALYSTPQLLWIACLFLMFWISHLWYYTFKGRMTDDPIIFSFKNKTSLITLVLIAIIILISI